MVQWNLIGVIGLGPLVVGLTLASLILASDHRRVVNRRLATLLMVEGFTLTAYLGFSLLAETREVAYIWAFLNGPLTILSVGAYLAFLATLRTPMVAWLRRRRAIVALGAWSVVALVVMLSRPRWFVLDVEPAEPMTWLPIYGLPVLPVSLYLYASLVFGLVVTISLYRRTQPGTGARAQAGAYLAAFVVRDAGILLSSGLAAAAQLPIVLGAPAGTATVQGIGWVSMSITSVAFGLLMTYGLLRNQLLGIEIDVVRAAKAASIVALGALAGLLASAAARRFLNDPLADALAFMVVATLALTLAFRVFDHGPGSRGPRNGTSPLDRDARRLHVYQAALEGTKPERSTGGDPPNPTLDRLREVLPISQAEHELVEAWLERAGERDQPDILPGHLVLGKYRIEEPLGSGGQGTVFRARDVVLERDVVVKVLPAPGKRGETMLREARVLARISHPRVITVHDAERVGERACIVTEHLAGGSLAKALADGPLDRGRFHFVATHLLAGIQAVHEAGLLHRDIKPSNVLFDGDGAVKLADLGMAQGPSLTLEDRAQTPSPWAEGVDHQMRTIMGPHVEGTVSYMSPEQARGEPLDVASDLYSAATTLLEALTGAPHLVRRHGEPDSRFRQRVAAGQQPTMEQVRDPALLAWFARSMDPDPVHRYPDARTMTAALPGG